MFRPHESSIALSSRLFVIACHRLCFPAIRIADELGMSSAAGRDLLKTQGIVVLKIRD